MANRGRPTLQKRERERAPNRKAEEPGRAQAGSEGTPRQCAAALGRRRSRYRTHRAGPQPLADWQAEALEQDEQQEQEDDLHDVQDA